MSRKLFSLTVWFSLLPAMVGGMELKDVRSFSYWLSGPDPALIAASGFDLAIVDYSGDGTDKGAFPPGDVSLMQRKPDSGRRIVLSYLSIGEAEDYRGYWQPEWSETPPPWLEEENPDWAGNFKVRYWHPDWQTLIFGRPESYLDRIIDAGFDGVYLDIVDAYWHFQEKGRKTAAADMVDFVTALAIYARERKPGFLIVPQNAEDLLAIEDYLAIIDAQAKEDLLFGQQAEPDDPNPEPSVLWSKKHLDLAVKAGKPVLLIEYPDMRSSIDKVYARGAQAGYIAYATVRELDRMVVNRNHDPAFPGISFRD